MSRKPDDPGKSLRDGDGADTGHWAPNPAAANDRTKVLSMTSSPAFDAWLDDQAKRLAKAATTAPDPRLVELIQNWAPKDHK
jgi:hypothetical protein